MKRLEGKTAVVVGAGSMAPGWSNGKACAVSYAREGAAVVCADYSVERAEDTARLIREAGGRAIAQPADATKEADVQALADRTMSYFGRLDVMHNNVGVGGTFGTPDQIPPDAWDREMSQNVTSAYLGIRCAVPAMRESGGGVIINVSSLLAVRFLKRPSVGYAAAKGAVESMTRACAAAYGREGIRVNCIRIGFSETPVVMAAMEARKLSPEQRDLELQRSRSKVPLLGQHGDPFDVAAAALFLASDEAGHITGVILNVDGGLECAPI
jgi:NAD(P)-dependent dehydrogenase (short-subunit alcohol dehydrogenase family)